MEGAIAMANHTSGPWEVLQSDGYLQIVSDGNIAHGVASVYARNGVSAMYANAKLIAAAPDLLEALEKLLFNHICLVESGDCGKWNVEEEVEVIAARKVISRAKGESNG